MRAFIGLSGKTRLAVVIFACIFVTASRNTISADQKKPEEA
jgi:hypothetical protein